MKILVTGGMGFIGNKVVKLLEKDHTVLSYDSLTTYGILDQHEVNSLVAERQVGMESNNVVGDIRNLPLLLSTIASSKPDVIIHLASFPRAKVVNADPVMGSEVMTTALMSLLIAAKEQKIKRFVYISSSMVYGDFASGVTVYATCNPKGSYAIFKYAGELLVKDFCLQNNIEYTIVRPSAVYGPMDVEDRVVSKFLINAMHNLPIKVNGEKEVLDFTYVDDIANGICLAATSENAANETFNITRGEGHTLLEAAQLAIEITNSKSEIIINDKDSLFPSRGSLNIDKAKLLLDYQPTTNIREGFKLYAEWLNDSIYGS